MKFSAKRRLDYVIGEPVCGLIDLGMRVLGRLLRRDHRLSPDFKQVWIIKFVGMGTVVNAVPLLRGLRQTYRQARITFITFPGMAPLLQRLPEVDHLHVLHDDNLLRLAWDCLVLMLKAWRTKPELVVDLEAHSRFSTILASVSAARNRAGFYHSTALFRSGLYTHLMFFNRFNHILDCHRQLGRMLGCETDGDEKTWLGVTAEEKDEARCYLEEAGVTDPTSMILVNANAGPLCKERRWPREKFALLIETMIRDLNRTVVLIGAPLETEANETVRALICEPLRRRVRNAAGKLSFGGTLALIDIAPLLVTNDTGPLHFAAALGTPTVSLWGPGAPQSYAPRGDSHRAVSESIYCSPCLYMADEPPCAGDNQCMKRLAVSKVLAAVIEVLGLEQQVEAAVEVPSQPSPYLPGYMGRQGVPLG